MNPPPGVPLDLQRGEEIETHTHASSGAGSDSPGGVDSPSHQKTHKASSKNFGSRADTLWKILDRVPDRDLKTATAPKFEISCVECDGPIPNARNPLDVCSQLCAYRHYSRVRHMQALYIERLKGDLEFSNRRPKGVG